MLRGVDVLAPDGRRWTVRRRWVPRMGSERLLSRMRRRTNGIAPRAGDSLDATSGLADLFDHGIFFAIGLVAAALLLALVVVPVLIAVLDIIVVVGAALVGIVARGFGWHPWVIDAVADDGSTRHWGISGGRASREQVRTVAAALQAGVSPPP